MQNKRNFSTAERLNSLHTRPTFLLLQPLLAMLRQFPRVSKPTKLAERRAKVNTRSLLEPNAAAVEVGLHFVLSGRLFRQRGQAAGRKGESGDVGGVGRLRREDVGSWWCWGAFSVSLGIAG